MVIAVNNTVLRARLERGEPGVPGRLEWMVTEWTIELADALDDLAANAALLHDASEATIQMLSQAIEGRDKPGPLTHAVFDVMNEHVELGYRIPAKSEQSLLKMAASIAQAYHEHGTARLSLRTRRARRSPSKGGSPPWPMCSTRWSVVALQVGDATRASDRHPGGGASSFDPNVVDVFIELIDEVQSPVSPTISIGQAKFHPGSDQFSEGNLGEVHYAMDLPNKICKDREIMLSGADVSLPVDSIVEQLWSVTCRSPHAPALEYVGELMTYESLWRRSSAIVDALLDVGVQAGDRVVLWAHRAPAIVAAAIACLRVRAAYVPIDPNYPSERIAQILEDSAPRLVLHDGRLPLEYDQGQVPTIDVATLGESQSRQLPNLEPHDIAYVVYTSGSTGRAKGVSIHHRALVNYVSWCADTVGSRGRGSPLFASLGFDHAVTCLWVPLIQGKCVTLVPEIWEQDDLWADRREPYTFLKLTPSHARFFENSAKPQYGSLTNVIMFGGEQLDSSLLRELDDRLSGIKIMNHYGPTEVTVGCCSLMFDLATIPNGEAIPIGWPIWNTRAYVCDDDLREVPLGSPGELIIAGAGVAQGYLGHDSHAAFLPESELGVESTERAYRTGDIVRSTSAGLLYLGRNDEQIKLGGYRIELGEIRSHIFKLPGVAEVAVSRASADGLVLEVLVVPSEVAERATLALEVKACLGAVLPAALVPRDVRIVGNLVFNAHGKCDVVATRELAI